MEDGAGAISGGHGHRRVPNDRRKTVSGAISYLNDDSNGQPPSHTAMRLPWNSTVAASNPPSSSTPSQRSTAHKRTFSGTIFSKLSFLRNNSEDGPLSTHHGEPMSPTKSTFSRKSIDDDAKQSPQTSPTKPEVEGAPSAGLKQNKTRKRKGSLRKTALLGGRRITSDGRERKGSFSLLQRPSYLRQASQKVAAQDDAVVDIHSTTGDDSGQAPFEGDAVSRTDESRSPYAKEDDTARSNIEESWSEPAAVTTARLALLTEHKADVQRVQTSTAEELGSSVDVKSPTSRTSYTSTTDDDDILTFSRPTKSYASQTNATLPPLSSPPSSYFPSQTALTTARSRTSLRSSPLSHSIAVGYPEPEPHDYTETEYWGWVILFVTWLTFTVGMGSCLEIWSWAWDVGETPYAPPELEDDDTLPIVGYYPALIVLTGVVAWVWITVAWVGMKYFRHAKIEV